MSRAFVKESAESAPPPERMVSEGPNLVTREGAAQIAGHVTRLEAALQTESNVLLRETLERDLRYWSDAKARAQIAPEASGDEVAFGSRVTFSRGGRKQTFRIVGEDEADPKQGSISWRSPLAQAMIGARSGDVIEGPLGEIEILALA
jgi:transcription elongation GreA/GreB family factor